MSSDKIRVKKSKVNQFVQTELTAALYKNFATSLITLFTVVSVLAFVLSQAIEKKYLLRWYMFMCTIIAARLLLLLWYNQSKLKSSLERYHYYLFVLGSSLSALALGFLGSILMPEQLMYQFFTLILISGIVAGAVQSLVASYLANITFIYFATIPLLIWEFIQIMKNQTIYIGIFITMLIFCFFSSIVARRGYQLLANHLELGYNYKTLFHQIINLKNKYKEQATHDLLTGLYNRQFLDDYFDVEIKRAKRNNLEISLIMIDIDFLKNINDTFGHECGDEVLKLLGSILENNVRKSDIACRYGGDEFIIMMPETSLEAAAEVAEFLRKTIKHASMEQKTNKNIKGLSVSMGVSSFPKNGITRSKIINAADKALYSAKKAGRNKVALAKK